MLIRTPLEIVGLVLGISALIAGGYIIVERLISGTLFSIFLKMMPAFLHSLFPNDATILWFTVRTNRNLYGSWDVALIYVLLTTITFLSFIGCWLFLVLKLLGIFNIGTNWLIFWFTLITLNYAWSASNQYALEIKFHDRRLGFLGIKNRMQSNPIETLKRWSYYFWSNWIRAPLTALKLLSIAVLFVLLHWPAWLIQIIPAFRFDLASIKIRRHYYAWYTVTFGVIGLILTTLYFRVFQLSSPYPAMVYIKPFGKASSLSLTLPQ